MFEKIIFEKPVGVEKKALVVDDQANMRMMIGNLCSQLGYKVQRVGDGAQALTILLKNREKFDLMLCDWNMPKIPGITVVEELSEAKEKDHSLALPIILMVTGQNFESEIARAGENMGLIHGYILKPLTLQVITAKIKSAQEKHTRKERIDELKREGEQKMGYDNPNRYDAAISQCFKEDSSINQESAALAKKKRVELIQQMEHKLIQIQRGSEKFKNFEEKEKYLAKLEKLKKEEVNLPFVIWPLLEAARLMDMVGDHVGALNLLDDIQEKKVSAWVYAEKGKIHENQGNTLMAIKEYKEAITLNSKFLYARDHLTALLEKRGKHKEALEVTQEAVKISPDSPNRRRQEGALCMELERFEEAEEAFKHTLEVEKGKNTALNNLNIGKSMLAQPEKVNLAFNYLGEADKAVQRRAENTGSVVKREIFLNYGDFYLKTGNLKSADQNLRFAMEKVINDPDDKENDHVKMAKAGEVYLKNNYLDKAKSLMEKVLDEDPKNKERQQLVHNIYKKHKKDELADELIKSAMDKADEAILTANSENLKRRKNAVNLADQGKFEEAKKVFLEALNLYDKLLKKYPSDDGLLFNKGVLLTQVLGKIVNSLDNETIKMFQEEKIDLFKRAYKLDPARISEGLKKIGISLSDIGIGL